MSDKIVIKYTKNGVISENLATTETQQLTTSDWGKQLRYNPESQLYYKTSDNVFEINTSNNLLSNKLPNNSFKYRDSTNKSINKNQSSQIYSSKIKNKQKQVNNCTKNKHINPNILKRKSNMNINLSTNNINTSRYSYKKSKYTTPSSKIKSTLIEVNSGEHKSNILDSIDTNIYENNQYKTSLSGDIVSQVYKKSKISTKFLNKASSLIKTDNNKNDNQLSDNWLSKLISSLIFFIGVILLIPFLLIFSTMGIENTVTKTQNSYDVILPYISQLDNELHKEIDDKVNEDNKIPNTEVIVENKEVIGTMTNQIVAIAMSKLNFVDSLTDDYKSTIKSIYNLTYEYRIIINTEVDKTKKTYRIFALSLDELIYKMGLSDEETNKTQEFLQILNSINIPDSGEDIPPSNPNGFANPLKKGTYRVTQEYGNNGHKGIDLGAGEGTPIYASADGIVRFAGFGIAGNGFNGYGNCVFIDHQNGFYTIYGHASALYVSVGQNVKQGQHIAGVGNTGNSFGNHLHFEIRTGFQHPRINPRLYIDF